MLRGAEGAAELGRIGKFIEGTEGAAREAGLLDRGLVETHPLGIKAAKPKLRMATDGIKGIGYEVEPATRLIYERGTPTGYALDDGDSVVRAASADAPVPESPETPRAQFKSAATPEAPEALAS